jgi:hypothetical protein
LIHVIGWLPQQGDQLTSAETTEVFFGVTKLFQSNNSNLRRMMYLFIKEVRTRGSRKAEEREKELDHVRGGGQ